MLHPSSTTAGTSHRRSLPHQLLRMSLLLLRMKLLLMLLLLGLGLGLLMLQLLLLLALLLLLLLLMQLLLTSPRISRRERLRDVRGRTGRHRRNGCVGAGSPGPPPGPRHRRARRRPWERPRRRRRRCRCCRHRLGGRRHVPFDVGEALCDLPQVVSAVSRALVHIVLKVHSLVVQRL